VLSPNNLSCWQILAGYGKRGRVEEFTRKSAARTNDDRSYFFPDLPQKWKENQEGKCQKECMEKMREE